MSAAVQQAQRNRNSIFVESGELVSIERFAGDQFVMRIRSPKCAAAAKPGNFVHVSCDESVPMRRPLSIMRADGDIIEILYKIVGDGLRWLSAKRVGDVVSVLGPIGQPFTPSPDRPNTLLIGGGVGIPPIVFLAEALQQTCDSWQPLAILGSELPFPFEHRISSIATPWAGDNVRATMPLLEDWGIACRLTTLSGFDDCFDGYVTGLAERWLSSLNNAELNKTAVFCCGPTPMLEAVATMAEQYDIPCQVSLEEYMACAVGGCAGCAVRIRTADGDAMKRVCVDGPVFDATDVVWA